MPSVLDWTSPQTVIREMGFSPLRSLGQNFMQDRNVLDFMLKFSDLDSNQDTVVEIGPGTGALTQYLIPNSISMCVFELDQGLGEYLDATYSSPEFKVVRGDILASKKELNPELEAFWNIQKALGRRCKLVSNLPYNILTPLLWNLMLKRDQWSLGVFLVQREFAERLKARPSETAYAPLSIFIQLSSKVEVLKPVSKNSFWPVPDVESSLIRLTPFVGVELKIEFLEFVKTAFSQRRKTLSKVMKSQFSFKLVEENLEKLGFSPKSRAESLEPASLLALWLKLTEA